MNDQPGGPSGGDIIGGLVLILFGLCILLVGGGCTILWIVVMVNQSSWGSGSDEIGMLFISLLAAAAGLFSLVKGVQLFRGKRG